MALTLVTAPTVEPLTVAEVRSHLLLNQTAGEPAPPAPTVALASPAAAGDCDNGAWRVGFTFVTADGETELGDLSDLVTVADNSVNGQIAITNIAIGGSSVTSRKGYAIPPGGSVALLFATIADNSTTDATLNAAASSLGAQAPSTNTTVDPGLVDQISAARERGELATRRAWNDQTWDLVLDGFPACGWLEIPKPPLQSISYVKYRDTTGTLVTWNSANYVVEAPAGPQARRGRLSLAYGISWPSTYGQAGDVTVRFVCGYGATGASVPARLRQAMLFDIASAYAFREQEIVGTIAMERPNGSTAIYRSFKSYPTQGGA